MKKLINKKLDDEKIVVKLITKLLMKKNWKKNWLKKDKNSLKTFKNNFKKPFIQSLVHGTIQESSPTEILMIFHKFEILESTLLQWSSAIWVIFQPVVSLSPETQLLKKKFPSENKVMNLLMLQISYLKYDEKDEWKIIWKN